MNRRDFLKGLVATAAGVLVPGEVAAEPERRIWALDKTMFPNKMILGDHIPVHRVFPEHERIEFYWAPAKIHLCDDSFVAPGLTLRIGGQDYLVTSMPNANGVMDAKTWIPKMEVNHYPVV